jgi:hypothetical protein
MTNSDLIKNIFLSIVNIVFPFIMHIYPFLLPPDSLVEIASTSKEYINTLPEWDIAIKWDAHGKVLS